MVREKANDLKSFDRKEQRLDKFYYSLLQGNEEFSDLWGVVKVILLLSHRQARVERDFSMNEDMLLTNMKKEALIGLKTVYDAMKSLDIKVHQFTVTDNILKSCHQAREKYDIYLMDMKTEEAWKVEKRKLRS